MNYLMIKNWSEHQHYKDRNPPWIKLHRALLDSYEFNLLPDAAKGHLLLIWLLASQYEGRIPADPHFIATRIGARDPVDLSALVKAGFLIAEQPDSDSLANDASNLLAPPVAPVLAPVLATCSSICSPRRGEESREDLLSGKPDQPAKELEAARGVLAYLNAKAKTGYRPVGSNLRLIAARLKEGASPEDLRRVIDAKAQEWGEDQRMARYLRPETLFNATKFASYVGALEEPEPARRVI